MKRITKTRNQLRRRRTSIPKKAGAWSYACLFVITIAGFFPLLLSQSVWSTHDHVERSTYTSDQRWQDAWKIESLRDNDPISLTSYWIEQAIPLPISILHYGINITLHLIAAILILKILQRLDLDGAWAAAMVFVIHPTTVQTLFWPGYRHEIVGLIAILTAFSWGIDRDGRKYYIKYILLTVVACIIHPAALAIPFISILCNFKKESKIRLEHINYLLPVLCLCLFIGLWIAGSASNVLGNSGDDGLLQTMGQNMNFFFKQAFLPTNPSLFYATNIEATYTTSKDIFLLPFLLFVPFFLLAIFNLRKGWARAIIFGLLSYLLLLIPGLITRGAFIDGTIAHEDHAHYVALPAIISLIICGAATIAHRVKAGTVLAWRIGMSILLITELTLTASFAYSVSKPERMWKQIVTTWPESTLPKIAYIDTLIANNSTDLPHGGLLTLLEEILEKEPDNITIRTIYAGALRQGREFGNAYKQYQRVLRESEPSQEFIKEAVDFYGQIGKQWEADKIRKLLK